MHTTQIEELREMTIKNNNNMNNETAMVMTDIKAADNPTYEKL